MRRNEFNRKQIEDSRNIAEQERKRNESDALIWFTTTSRELKTPTDPMRRRQPKIKRHQSREQRIAEMQTKNPIAAIYGEETEWNETPLLPDDAETTREVGPDDRYNSRINYRTGKKTETANGEGNKRAYRGRRAYGGGNNRKSFSRH